MSRKAGDPVTIAIGKRIRQCRMERGLSQERLGEEVGVTFQQIQKYEKGTNRISATTLLRVSHILEIRPSQLLEPSSDSPADWFSPNI
jgi:transcriptional regulator with XRE-family HTH domain